LVEVATLAVRIEAARAEGGFRVVRRGSRQTRDELGRFVADVNRTDASLDRTGRTAQGFGRILGRLTAGLSAGLITRAAFRQLVDFEQGLVGVGKTTDIAGEALQALGDDFIALGNRIPVTRDELLSIGQAAGQLGVTGADNILNFTDTIAKLGSASDLAGDEAATTLARLLNVTGEGIDQVDEIASVFVRLGNNIEATESEIATITTRIAQATAAFDLSAGETAALGAALKSLGVEAELGGSSVGRAFTAIDAAVREAGDDLELLAQIAGTTNEEFAQLFQGDQLAGFQAFIEGLGRTIEQGGSAAAVLDQLGLSGVRNLQVLVPLAKNNEQLAKTLALVSDELANTNALEEESSRAFDTLGSELTLLGNALGAAVLQFRDSTGPIKDFVEGVRGAVLILSGLGDEFDGNRERAELFAKVLRGLAGAGGFIALTKAVQGTIGAIRALKVALATSGIGLIPIAIGAAIGAVITFREEIADLTIGGRRLGDVLTATINVLRERWEFIFPRLVEVARGVIETLSRLFSQAFDFIVDLVQDALELIGTDWDSALGFIGDLVKGFANLAIASFKTVGDAILTVVETIVDNFRELRNLDFSNPIAFVGSLKDVSLANLERSIDALKDIGGSAAENFSTDFVAEFTQIGKDSLTALVGGFRGLEGEAAFDEFFGGIFREIDEEQGRIAAERFARGLIEQLQTKGKQVLSALGFQPRGEGDDGGPGDGAGARAGFEQAAGGIAQLDQARTDALNTISDMFAALEFEKELVGLTNDERQLAIELRELERQAILGQVVDVDTLTEAYRKSAEELERQVEQAEKQQASADLIAQGLGDVARSAITDYENLGEAAEQAFKRVIDGLLEVLAIQPLIQGISSFLGPTNGPGTGGLGAFFSAKGNVFRGGQVVPFQNGGLFSGPTAFPLAGGNVGIAGEAGPEAAIAPLSRKNGRLGVEINDGAAGRTVIQNFNISTPNPDGFRQSMEQVKQDAKKGLDQL